MKTMKGDYIGFTYNGVHSSDLGIIRVSDGSRFNKNLLPTIQDKTAQVPGRDGTYYFGSYFTNRVISISFAFDSMTEAQLNYLEELLSDKNPHPLIFDELPYKTYFAKITGSSTIKYIPFSEGMTNRIYKGEGSIQFTCYQPYAICSKKFLNEYSDSNVDEWREAANLMEEQGVLDILTLEENNEKIGSIKVYNPGIKTADWRLSIMTNTDNFEGMRLELDDELLVFSTCPKINEEDEFIVFDSKTRLVEGYKPDKVADTGLIKTYKKSGSIYNQYIIAGDFFDIPITIEKTLTGVKKNTKTLKISLENNSQESVAGIFKDFNYNYYYL